MSGMFDQVTVTAVVASLLHVVNYNATAHLEHRTRIFTRIIGRHAVYCYAVYLVLSALLRDYFINQAVAASQNTLVLFSPHVAFFLGGALFVGGFLLNLWTLKALGIKGMYNGDSFGFLMKELVTDGPYAYFNDPQYVGTAGAFLGAAIYNQSLNGYVIAVAVGIIFYLSAKFVEGPHMAQIYGETANRIPKMD